MDDVQALHSDPHASPDVPKDPSAVVDELLLARTTHRGHQAECEPSRDEHESDFMQPRQPFGIRSKQTRDDGREVFMALYYRAGKSTRSKLSFLCAMRANPTIMLSPLDTKT